MRTGWDVVMLMCRHNDHVAVEANALYADCDGCGNIETLCSQCIAEAVADANQEYSND